MKLKNKRIGICMPEIPIDEIEFLNQLKKLRTEDAIIDTVIDFKIQGKRKIDFFKKIETITSNKIIYSKYISKIIENKIIFDILVIVPCSENIIPELSHDIFNKPIMRLVNYQLINNKPIVLGIRANNALSHNAENIGRLLNKKNHYFIPFKQSNPITKPYFISFDYSYLLKTLQTVLDGKQIQPILISL